MASDKSQPCAACKYLRRKCTLDCVFAPHFPPEQPWKFESVHKVFGASNVGKILTELPFDQREEAAISLVYEAQARLRDPVYGCVGHISLLQDRLKQVHTNLHAAKQELSGYLGTSAMMSVLVNPGHIRMQQQLPTSGGRAQVMPPNMQPPMSGQGPRNAQHHQQMIDAALEQQLRRNFELQQYERQVLQQLQHHPELQQLHQQHQQQLQQHQLINRGIDGAGASGQVNTSGFTYLTGPAVAMSPTLTLGGVYDNAHQIQIQQQHHQQLLQQQQQEQHHHNQLQQLRPHQHQVFVQPHPLQPQPQPPQPVPQPPQQQSPQPRPQPPQPQTQPPQPQSQPPQPQPHPPQSQPQPPQPQTQPPQPQSQPEPPQPQPHPPQSQPQPPQPQPHQPQPQPQPPQPQSQPPQPQPHPPQPQSQPQPPQPQPHPPQSQPQPPQPKPQPQPHRPQPKPQPQPQPPQPLPQPQHPHGDGGEEGRSVGPS